jgi:hypothetical protein
MQLANILPFAPFRQSRPGARWVDVERPARQPVGSALPWQTQPRKWRHTASAMTRQKRILSKVAPRPVNVRLDTMYIVGRTS